MKLQKFQRTGNWYNIELDNTNYNVLIQKYKDSTYCESSSVIVFDENLKWIEPRVDEKIYETIEKIMEKVDWKYDMVDED
jgi:hypothetical protein